MNATQAEYDALHEAYLKVLDERDELKAKLADAVEAIAIYRAAVHRHLDDNGLRINEAIDRIAAQRDAAEKTLRELLRHIEQLEENAPAPLETCICGGKRRKR